VQVVGNWKVQGFKGSCATPLQVTITPCDALSNVCKIAWSIPASLQEGYKTSADKNVASSENHV